MASSLSTPVIFQKIGNKSQFQNVAVSSKSRIARVSATGGAFRGSDLSLTRRLGEVGPVEIGLWCISILIIDGCQRNKFTKICSS
jgi:hypothetical protein